MQTAALRRDEDFAALRLFDKAAFSQTHYPRLKAVFERMVAASLDNLRELCAAPPRYTFKDVYAEALGAAVDETGDDGMVAVFDVPQWDGHLLFTVDRPFVYTVTELFFGGDGSEPQFEEKRRFSQLEKNVVRAILTSSAQALQASLLPANPDLSITMERIETDTELLTIDEPESQAVVARFELHALERTGELRIIIPRATVRSARSRRAGGADDQHSELSRQMQGKIEDTEVRLRAVLEERQMTLGEISSLKVGQLLPLQARVDGRINLECNDEPFFVCEVGQSDGFYTLRVDHVLERSERARA